jgi:sugar-phosphatase
MNNHVTLDAEALLFDMDGTLVDSTVLSERIWRAWSGKYGFSADGVLAYSHGRRTLDTTRHFAASEEAARSAASEIEAQEIAAEDGAVAIDGAKSLLEELSPGCWAVVTSAGRAVAVRRLAAAGLPIPEVLITGGDVSIGKPDPEGYLLAAQRLGVKPSHCIVFEDTYAGHEAARRGGMRSINRHAVPHDHGGALLTLLDYSAVKVRVVGTSLQLSMPPADGRRIGAPKRPLAFRS